MAKVQIIMPVTLDGFLPGKNEELMEWLRTDRNGFPYWEERATFNMFPHYGMLDLMDAKRDETITVPFYESTGRKKCRICWWSISLPTRR